MDRDKAIEKMAIHLEFMSRKLGVFNLPTCRKVADQLVSIIINEKELSALQRDAEKWRKVEEIAKRNWIDSPCDGCPVIDVCDVSNSLCGQADSVVHALKEPT